MSTRVDFEARLGFQLDDFQRRALDALDAGRSVLVAAPTGSGKTLVAEYAIEHSLARGGKAFYTTPLKALSNQKYGDLVRIHGRARVGLLTGDNSINGEAPVVVMTTEVLRNMIYAASPTLDDLRVVVLDEVHYLQDRYRGPVWEEIIVHLAPDVALVSLSATVSNAEEVAAWIETVRGETTPVIEERRPVLLQHRYLIAERDREALHLLPTFVGEGDDLRPNPDAERLDRRVGRRPRGQPSGSRRLRIPSRVEVTELLAAHDLLPAIVFVFSRAGCDQAVEQCRAAGVRLTSADERRQIRAIAEAHVEGLDDDDLTVLGYDAWLAGLEAGLAAHHAGMVPPMKEAVEEAFAAGLAKLVFATETLALGINMPARSVVIEKLTKFTGERHEFLTPGEYTQLTGRAGRRGIDVVGYAIVLWSPWVTFEQVAGLAARRTDALRSSFRPTYNMAVNLVRRYPPETAHRLLNLSFAQYHADREVVALERQLERTRELLDRQRTLAQSRYGDLGDYRRLVERRDAARRGGGAGRRIGRALEALRPGDVVWIGARGGKVLVLSQEARRGGVRLLGLTSSRQLVRLGVGDFSSPPGAIGHIDLPVPYAPRTRAFQREAVDALRRLKGQGSRRGDTGDDDVATLERALAEHPVAQDPERDARVRAAAAVQRLERDLARFERRVQGRTESLARQLDRVLGVLESWGYLSGWELTQAGEMLARVYTETDLLLAESIREGLLDELTPPELAALVSCFTYERRGADRMEPAPPARWPSKAIATRARDVDRLWRALVADEGDAGLPETRPPDPGFTAHVFEWARGDDLAAILDTDELTGGDFVRHVKQCIDLLRQIGDVAPAAGTRRSARRRVDVSPRRHRRGLGNGVMRRGAPWGQPAVGPADVLVRGTDADIADAVREHPGALVELDPASASDIGRAVGVAGRASAGTTELRLDAITLDAVALGADLATSCLAVNVVVLGTPPDRLARRHRRLPVSVHVDGRSCFEGRATTVVIATGQYLRGADLVPRGHPGDGRVEVQVYDLAPGQRTGMRRRLAGGIHVPHPGILEASGRTVEVATPRGWPLEVDGRPRGAHGAVTATLRAGAWRLLV